MSLFDTSTKAVKFTTVGDTVTGVVSAGPFQRQQTKFGTNLPDFYDNGDPKMQILVPLTTDRREGPADDGERTLYVSSAAMKRAIGTAIRDAGAEDLEIGGTLMVTFTGFDPGSKNPANPAKLYTASYTKPQIGTLERTPPVVVAQVSVPLDEAKVHELIALGFGDEQIATALGLTLAEVHAVRSNTIRQ